MMRLRPVKQKYITTGLVRERNRTRSLDQVLDELHQSHARLITALTQTPFDKLLQPRYADDPEDHILLCWVIGDTYEHYQEHAAILDHRE